MLYLKAFTLASLLGTTIAAPYATTVDNSIPNIILERSPAATSAAGSTSSTLSCPSSDGATFTSSGYSFIVECGLDRPGNINMVYTANFATCIDACAAYSGCVDVSYVSDGGGACYMKNSILAGASSSGIWGARQVSASGTTSTTVKTSTTKTTSSTTTSKTTTSSKTTTTSSKTTTTSSKTTTTAAATTTASATGKRGLAYNTGAYGALFTPYPEVSWGYNVSGGLIHLLLHGWGLLLTIPKQWGQSRSGLSTHFDYVPMLVSSIIYPPQSPSQCARIIPRKNLEPSYHASKKTHHLHPQIPPSLKRTTTDHLSLPIVGRRHRLDKFLDL